MMSGLSSLNLGGVQLKRLVQIGIVVADRKQTTEFIDLLIWHWTVSFRGMARSPGSQVLLSRRRGAHSNQPGVCAIGRRGGRTDSASRRKRNAYQDFLDETGGGIHHVLFEVNDIDPVLREVGESWNNGFASRDRDPARHALGTVGYPGKRWDFMWNCGIVPASRTELLFLDRNQATSTDS